MPGTLWMSRDPWNCVTAGGSYRLVRLQGGKLSGKKSGCLSDAPHPKPVPITRSRGTGEWPKSL